MKFTIEKVKVSDATAVLEYLKKIGGESDNLTFGAEGLPFSVADEEKYIESLQNSTSSAMFLAKRDGKIIGDASFNSVKGNELNIVGNWGFAC